MTTEKKKRVVRAMVGSELELDCIRKIHRQLARLPDVKGSIRVLAYIQSVTHEGSPAYAKQVPMYKGENGMQGLGADEFNQINVR